MLTRGLISHAGHYAGTTSQQGTISFDVSERDGLVTNLMLTVTARGKQGERAFVDLPVTVGQVFRVGLDGRWRGRVSGAGVAVSVEAKLNGSKFSGELLVELESDNTEPLTTGPLTWYARRSD